MHSAAESSRSSLRYFHPTDTAAARTKVVGISAADAGQRRVCASKHLTNTLDVLLGNMGQV